MALAVTFFRTGSRITQLWNYPSWYLFQAENYEPVLVNTVRSRMVPAPGRMRNVKTEHWVPVETFGVSAKEVYRILRAHGVYTDEFNEAWDRAVEEADAGNWDSIFELRKKRLSAKLEVVKVLTSKLQGKMWMEIGFPRDFGFASRGTNVVTGLLWFWIVSVSIMPIVASRFSSAEPR